MKDFFMKTYFKDGRIPGGGIGGNINFAENITLSRFVIYIERENIGDPAFTPIITVKQGDFAVADKDDIDCTVRRFLFLFDQRDQLPDFFRGILRSESENIFTCTYFSSSLSGYSIR